MNSRTHELNISGDTLGLPFEGFGMISANGSSRLLPDYKRLHRESYDEILGLLFDKEKGLGMTLLKIEMGSDVNSSSGTQANIQRTAGETPDITRCEGMEIAADIKKIAPDISLDMLWWSVPKWTDNAADPYAARYVWYKNHLKEAYEKYGLKFDNVSANRNERAVEKEWIKYLAHRLRTDCDTPYDFSKIQIVAADECDTWNIAGDMERDGELAASVDILGSHYTSDSTPAAKKMLSERGKRLWFSEGSPSMSYCEGTKRFDGSGLTGTNGVLDMANRIIAMYARGKMTMYEFQPAVSAYYDGVCYCHKELISACTPNSGYYRLTGGYFGALHFARFIRKGWRFVDSGCFADGKPGGDGHCIVDSVYSCLTAADPVSGDHSSVITNTTSEDIEYHVNVTGLSGECRRVFVWETSKDGYLKKVNEISPERTGENYTYTVTVKPSSLVTVTTLDMPPFEPSVPDISRDRVFPLPYEDRFCYDERFLSERGGKPLYTTDQGGAFEVVTRGSGNVLQQMITDDLRAEEWGLTPEPVTAFGDKRWWDYSVSAGIALRATASPEGNYAGVGLRFGIICEGEWGTFLRLYESGKWEMRINKKTVSQGTIEGFDRASVHELTLAADGGRFTAYLGGRKLCEYVCTGAVPSAGCGALCSSFEKNYFTFLKVTPGDRPFAEFINDTDCRISYMGSWRHELMGSFKNYRRTHSVGDAGAAAEISFEGDSVSVAGQTEGCTVEISCEGSRETVSCGKTDYRECVYCRSGYGIGEHKLTLKVTEGSFDLDFVHAEIGE